MKRTLSKGEPDREATTPKDSSREGRLRSRGVAANEAKQATADELRSANRWSK